jgi:hypothetical protein
LVRARASSGAAAPPSTRDRNLQGKPVFYGVGSFSFQTGHGGRTHPDWVGLTLHVTVENAVLVRAAFSFVRHNVQNETVLRPVVADQANIGQLRRVSTRFSTALAVDVDEVLVWP